MFYCYDSGFVIGSGEPPGKDDSSMAGNFDIVTVADQSMSWLGKWRGNMDLGLTTWAETSNVNTSRSDCHAWGSSPNIEFFRTILGIDSNAPGFSKVLITPHLGSINDISGEMPHPNVKIAVNYKVNQGALQAEINLPEKTSGNFVWKEKTLPLKAGKNLLKL